MALTGTDRGTGGNTTSATSLAISPGSNFTPGTIAVLCVAYDNSGSSGADPFVSISDNAGNQWTRRVAVLQDPGAANAGSALAVFTAPISRLLTSDTVTVSFGSTSVPSKAWTLMEVAAAAGSSAEYVTQAGTAQATANPSITTTSIPSGDMVVGAFGVESTGAITADSDTSNGSWSTAQTADAGNGTSAANQKLISQRKIVTGTATQTLNVTSAAADSCIGWVQLHETPLPPAYLVTKARR